jgi:hypothetical protein
MSSESGQSRASLKAPMVEKVVEVGDLFASVLRSVEEKAPSSAEHVDVELVLNTITVDSRGFLVFSRSSESSIKLSLSTRIKPRGGLPV